jgi:hypothetical protein
VFTIKSGAAETVLGDVRRIRATEPALSSRAKPTDLHFDRGSVDAEIAVKGYRKLD